MTQLKSAEGLAVLISAVGFVNTVDALKKLQVSNIEKPSIGEMIFCRFFYILDSSDSSSFTF